MNTWVQNYLIALRLERWPVLSRAELQERERKAKLNRLYGIKK